MHPQGKNIPQRAGFMFSRMLIVSKRSSTGFQKKNFSETPCRCSEMEMNFL